MHAEFCLFILWREVSWLNTGGEGLWNSVYPAFKCTSPMYTVTNGSWEGWNNGELYSRLNWRDWCELARKNCNCVNPLPCLHAKFYRVNKKLIFTFYVSPPHWHDTGSWNSFSSMIRTYLFHIVNIMGADVLATQGARASATMLNPISPFPAC